MFDCPLPAVAVIRADGGEPVSCTGDNGIGFTENAALKQNMRPPLPFTEQICGEGCMPDLCIVQKKLFVSSLDSAGGFFRVRGIEF